MRPLFLGAGLMLAAGGTAVGVYLAVPSGSEEEVSPQAQATATATPSPVLPTVLATPSVTAPQVPAGWLAFSDAVNRVAFQYPEKWSLDPDDGTKHSTRIASFDLSTWGGAFPAGGVAVELMRIPLENAEPRRATATDAVVFGLQGWEFSAPRTEMGGDAAWARVHVFAADSHGFRYLVGGYFAEENPNEAAFLAIVNSLKLIDQ